MAPSWQRPAAAGLLCMAAAAALPATAVAGVGDATGAAAATDFTGELRLVATTRRASDRGPLAAADRLQPGIAPPGGDGWLAEAELRHTVRLEAGTLPLAVAGNVLLQAEATAGAKHGTDARVNELHVAADLGAWQAGAGRKVLGWDVGYGFRPNDVVQQEARRTLLATTPQGRPLLLLEHYGAEHALSLVWVNPQRWNDRADASRGPDESAWALRAYQRVGALDAHGFARHGRRTGSSVGAALAWVATDELELHASWRGLEDHDGWRIDAGAGDAPGAANPWRRVQGGRTTQWLVGASWTGLSQQGVLFEYWHDGTALADGDWDAWQRRNAALAAAPVPAAFAAGNLAWQATPLTAPSLRRDNLYLRLSWSPESWRWSLDTLYMPQDHGRIHTLALQWQGERWRLDAAWRVAAGADTALVAQVPTRRSLLLAATRPF